MLVAQLRCPCKLFAFVCYAVQNAWRMQFILDACLCAHKSVSSLFLSPHSAWPMFSLLLAHFFFRVLLITKSLLVFSSQCCIIFSYTCYLVYCFLFVLRSNEKNPVRIRLSTSFAFAARYCVMCCNARFKRKKWKKSERANCIQVSICHSVRR